MGIARLPQDAVIGFHGTSGSFGQVNSGAASQAAVSALLRRLFARTYSTPRIC